MTDLSYAPGEDRAAKAGTNDLVIVQLTDLPDSLGRAATLILNRADQLNAITWDMIKALDVAIGAVTRDESIRAVLITGAGEAFSAGGDLKAYAALQRDATRFPAFVADLQATFGKLRTLPVPVIALVNGVAAAGGLELLLNCDIAIAAESARIGDAHLNFGQMGGGGALTLLPRFIGISRAMELVVSGRFLTSAVAMEWGLINRTVSDSALLDEGLALVMSIAAKSPLAIANAKFVMNAVWANSLSLSSGLDLERERNSYYCLTSRDATEGLAAFTEKRSPKFTGR